MVVISWRLVKVSRTRRTRDSVFFRRIIKVGHHGVIHEERILFADVSFLRGSAQGFEARSAKSYFQ